MIPPKTCIITGAANDGMHFKLSKVFCTYIYYYIISIIFFKAAINLSSNPPDKCSFGVANKAKKCQKADDDIKQ